MQVDEVEQGELLLRPLGCLEPLRVEHAGPAMQFGIPFGVAPAQVRDQRLARQVVREQPAWPRLDKRQTAQPFKQFVSIGQTHQLGQQGLGGNSHQRAGFQRCPVCRARHLLQELLQQDLDDVGRLE